MERDREITICLQQMGWTVLRFWEGDIQADLEGIVSKVIASIPQGNLRGVDKPTGMAKIEHNGT